MQTPSDYSAPNADRPFGEVIDLYLDSPKFRGLAVGTQSNYARLLLFAKKALGHVPASVIRPAIVQGLLDGMASDPGRQINTRVALKAVEKWAVVRDHLLHPITLGTEVVGGGDGHQPWTERQIDAVVQHAKPEVSRVILVAAATGQRGSDLIKMAWSDIEEIDGRLGIHVKQRKTGVELWIPFTQALTAAVRTWERRPAPLLVRDEDGRPWASRDLLTRTWERERDSNPELRVCRGMVLHGLRASACIRLRRLGCSEAEISAMVGLSVPMVSRYCRKSVQVENAMAAVMRMDGTPYEQTHSKVKIGTVKS